MIKVSVIVPVFNTEKYLNDCLDSLVNQTLTKIEIVIVNDGSTDGSEDIIKKYSDEFAFVKVFKQNNKGQGAARNYALAKAQGKYIYFMDSDDYLEKNALEKIYFEMEKNQLDCLFFDGESFLDYEYINGTSLKNTNYKRHKSYGEFQNGQVLWYEFRKNNEFNVSPCLYMVKRKSLERNNLRFVEGIINEDQIFTSTLYFNIKKCSHYNWSLFHRRIRNGSTMTSSKNGAKLKAHIEIFNSLYELFEKDEFLNDKIRSEFQKYLSDVLILTLSFSNKNFAKDIKDIKKLAKEHNYFTIKGHIASGYPKMYKVLSKVKNF